jgi:hypothetical protein
MRGYIFVKRCNLSTGHGEDPLYGLVIDKDLPVFLNREEALEFGREYIMEKYKNFFTLEFELKSMPDKLIEIEVRQ